jgi:hypothetical protein
MATQRIVFGEWMPDKPGITGALTEAFNVVPKADGYGPLASIVELSGAASQPLIKVFAGKFSGTTTLFAAGATKLFRFNSTTLALDDVSKLVMASPTTYSSTNNWDFTQFGNAIIAANGQNTMQAWSLGSAANFIDLSASAPSASYVTVVRDFVVAARDATNPNRVYWSDINDETNWTPGPTSQSDFQDVPDGGDIVGIRGGEVGLIFLERAVVRMSYIGSPLFFQFDTISRNLGCFEPKSIAQYGQMVFFLSDDGFYMCDGQTITPIGVERVDKFFYKSANINELEKMSSAIDPINKLVVWCYQNNDGDQELLVYNWQLNRWSRGVTAAGFISTAASAGVTLEGLDAYGNIDTLETSLDSRLWAGGKMLLAGGLGSKIGTFTGSSMPGDIRTGDFRSGEQSIVKLAKPQVDGGSAQVSIASRVRLDGQINYSNLSPADNENRVSLRSVGAYHRLRLVPIGDDWQQASAVDIDLQPVSGR